MASPGAEKSPAFDGRGSTFLDYAHQLHLWIGTSNAELAARASLLMLQVQPASRQVCPAEGSAISDRGDGATRLLDIARSFPAPGAAVAIRQQVVRFMNYRRTDQFINEYIAEYALL